MKQINKVALRQQLQAEFQTTMRGLFQNEEAFVNMCNQAKKDGKISLQIEIEVTPEFIDETLASRVDV